jgi:hypothetical protein
MHVKSIDEAVYDTAHGYKGGAQALGAVVGIGGTVLSSKCNPNTTTHHLTLREAVRIMGLTGDHQILRAVCYELGYLDPIRRIDGGGLADDALLDLLASVFSESGDVARVLQTSLADGRITRGEFGLIEEQVIEAQSALATLLDRVRSLVVDDARRPLRQVR